MAKFEIGLRSLETSVPRDAYAALRQKYRAIGESERRTFLQTYSSYFSSADDLWTKLPAIIEGAIARCAETALADIAAHQIYDVDDATLRSRLADQEAWGRGYLNFRDNYLAIVLPSAELEAEREERARNRGRVIGGGFGLDGAARGVALAAGANAALGIVHGLANQTGKAITAAGDKRKKRALFENPETRTTLGDTIYDLAFMTHEAVAELINERSEVAVFEPVSGPDATKAGALLQNLVQERVPPDKQGDVLFEALKLDPFREDIWHEWLARLGDADGSLALAAEMLGVVQLNDRKRTLIIRRSEELATDTPEACVTGVSEIEAYGAFLGFTVEPQRAALLIKADRLETQRRTYSGTTYATVEEAISVRAEAEDRQSRTFNGELYPTKEAALTAQADAAARKSRTFMGVEYETLADKRAAIKGYRRSNSVTFWVVAVFFPIPAVFFVFMRGFSIWQRIRLILWAATVVSFLIYHQDPSSFISSIAAFIVFGGIACAFSFVCQSIYSGFVDK